MGEHTGRKPGWCKSSDVVACGTTKIVCDAEQVSVFLHCDAHASHVSCLWRNIGLSPANG